jgi:hypothetical protein
MMTRRTKVLWTSLIGLLVILAVGYGVIKAKTYEPSRTAQTAASTATVTTNYTIFKGRPSKTAIVFYPGALVDPASYSIWAKQVAQQGHSVYLMHFPLNLAVLAGNRADQVPAKVRHNYVIGGHSLGGVMASRYAAKHPRGLKGIFYLASYPDKKGRLDHMTLPALSITASRDGVLNWSHYRQSKVYLPAHTAFAKIIGGNHAGFGSYGPQKGDHAATLANAQQQAQVSQLLMQWLTKLTK